MPDEIYRADLCRSAPFTLTRAESGTDGLSIEGYGAVFNSVTEINSWEGTFEEVIAPGAFRKSLRETKIKMQFDHGRHALLGSLPLGRWQVAEEDSRGLHLVGRLTDNWLIEPFRDAIRDEGVDGMSFRFSVTREEWRDKDGKILKEDELFELLWRGAGERGPLRRTLKEVRCTEAGPVVWPAYSDTQVGVRSADDGRQVVTIDLGALRDGSTTELSRLARLLAVADRDVGPDTPDDDADGDTSDTVTPATDASDDGGDETDPETPAEQAEEHDPHDSEPRSTEPVADEHPAPAAPPVTAGSAGEHSTKPVSPAVLRDQMRARYREYRDRLLAIPTN